jgi:metal-responsive CopG/Arc/MetJ family transcriptional regulator
MKAKTSVTLSEEVLKLIDRRARTYKSRSEFIEAAVTAFLAHLARQEQNAKDLEILNRRASALNQEAEDALEYQVVR